MTGWQDCAEFENLIGDWLHNRTDETYLLVAAHREACPKCRANHALCNQHAAMQHFREEGENDTRVVVSDNVPGLCLGAEDEAIV